MRLPSFQSENAGTFRHIAAIALDVSLIQAYIIKWSGIFFRERERERERESESESERDGGHIHKCMHVSVCNRLFHIQGCIREEGF